MTLFHQTVANHPDTPQPRVPTDAKGWCEQASVCEESGDWTRAVVCYRRAVQLAPFSAEIRERFEDAIEQQILAVTKGASKVRRVATEPPAARTRVAARQAPPPVRKASANNLFKVEDDHEGEDEILDEHDDIDEDDELLRPRGIGATKKSASAASRHSSFNGKPRYQRALRVGVIILAVTLTSAGLVAAVGTSQMIKGMFTGGAAVLPEGKVSAEIREVMNDANDLIDKGQYGEAVTLIESARQQHPRNVVELNGLMARVHRQQGNDAVRDKKYDIAAKSFAAATDADPQDTNNWISRGRALREQARTLSGSKNTTKRREALADSLKAFEKAIDLSPAYPAAYLGVAQVQEARANKTKAIEAYQQMIKIAPDSNEARLAKDAIAQLQKK